MYDIIEIRWNISDGTKKLQYRSKEEDWNSQNEDSNDVFTDWKDVEIYNEKE